MRNLLLYLTIPFIAALCFHPATANTLTATEKQITAAIKQEKDAQFALLEKLVNINSGTENIEGVQQVGEILRPAFEQLGFKTHWIEEPATMQRAGYSHRRTCGFKRKTHINYRPSGYGVPQNLYVSTYRSQWR
jgi:glutamate carboxypeptidase